jgi:hypothetical protein
MHRTTRALPFRLISPKASAVSGSLCRRNLKVKGLMLYVSKGYHTVLELLDGVMLPGHSALTASKVDRDVGDKWSFLCYDCLEQGRLELLS